LPDSPLKSMNKLSTNDCMIDQMLGKATIKQETNLIFPDEHTIPVLPKALVQDIETCLLHKFGPHHTNRQILIDTITHDLIEKYNLFYPSHKQFSSIGTAIVRKLQLPLTKDNSKFVCILHS
ncbi:unnamed protein product, partial [Didymodactylos carnosus]